MPKNTSWTGVVTFPTPTPTQTTLGLTETVPAFFVNVLRVCSHVPGEVPSLASFVTVRKASSQFGAETATHRLGAEVCSNAWDRVRGRLPRASSAGPGHFSALAISSALRRCQPVSSSVSVPWKTSLASLRSTVVGTGSSMSRT